jgi:hypothetical protein
MPDTVSGSSGPASKGITDADGRFKLELNDGHAGAIVGVHRVTVLDIDALPAPSPAPATPGDPPLTRKPSPKSRIAWVYNKPHTTPLTGFEVKPGRQKIDIELRNKP